MALEQHLDVTDGSRVTSEQAAAASGSSQPPADPAAAAAAAVPPEQAWGPTTLQLLRCQLQRFAAERDWDQYHTPRNLLLALVSGPLTGQAAAHARKGRRCLPAARVCVGTAAQPAASVPHL